MTTDYEEALAALQEDIKVGDVVSNPATDPLPMVVHEVLNPNRVRLFDSETGEEYLAPKSIVGIRPQTTTEGYKKGYGLLGDVTPTGEFRYVERKPDIPVKFRTYFKCRFHPDDIEFAKWQEHGYPICHKANIPSPASLEDHMRVKHANQWKAIERVRELEEREAQREEARLMREALTAALSANRAPITMSVPFPQTEPIVAEPTTAVDVFEGEQSLSISSADATDTAPVKKFLSQMNRAELMAYCDSKGYAYDPVNATKGDILTHIRNMEGIMR